MAMVADRTVQPGGLGWRRGGMLIPKAQPSRGLFLLGAPADGGCPSPVVQGAFNRDRAGKQEHCAAPLLRCNRGQADGGALMHCSGGAGRLSAVL